MGTFRSRAYCEGQPKAGIYGHRYHTVVLWLCSTDASKDRKSTLAPLCAEHLHKTEHQLPLAKPNSAGVYVTHICCYDHVKVHRCGHMFWQVNDFLYCDMKARYAVQPVRPWFPAFWRHTVIFPIFVLFVCLFSCLFLFWMILFGFG